MRAKCYELFSQSWGENQGSEGSFPLLAGGEPIDYTHVLLTAYVQGPGPPVDVPVHILTSWLQSILPGLELNLGLCYVGWLAFTQSIV